MIKTKVIKNLPTNSECWNLLCEQTGNLLQTTTNDQVQQMYANEPIYIEITRFDNLIGGVKLYQWRSSKIPVIIPYISNHLTQPSEFIYSYNENISEIKTLINIEIYKFLKHNHIVSFKSVAYYGFPDLIFSNATLIPKRTLFSIAKIDIQKSIEEITKCFHVKHRNSLNKALKSDLTFSETKDINVLINLLAETYSNQNSIGPNPDFVNSFFYNFYKDDKVKLYVVKKDDVPLCAALVQIMGDNAEYTFGGTTNNNFGAGQYLHWQIISELIIKGVKTYSLGQVSQFIDAKNQKFTEGISRFKMRFGCSIADSKSEVYILKPISYSLFNFLKKLYK